jgi:hypothetical protein
VARRLLTAFTMMTLTGLLVAGAVWGWNSLFAALPSTDFSSLAQQPTPTCRTEHVKAGSKVRAHQVRVSVFNAGSRSGLAGDTLDALMQRGFIGGELGNAPSGLRVSRVQVWTTTRGTDPAARLVARQFGRAVPVRHMHKNLGTGIDVVVGNGFRHLVKAPRAQRVAKPQKYCVPGATSAPPA